MKEDGRARAYRIDSGMNEMDVEFKSDWLVTQIELLKFLHGYEIYIVNEKMGCIDYVDDGGDHGKKLLRVMFDPQSNESRAVAETITKTVEHLEREGYEEAVVLAEDFTKVAKTRLRRNHIRFISPDAGQRFSISELLAAIQGKVNELCKAKCGKVPTRESDCKGHRDGKYTCPVRRISDDADFHAERRWLKLLMKDFLKLFELRREMSK